jgi:hypothetical protein
VPQRPQRHSVLTHSPPEHCAALEHVTPVEPPPQSMAVSVLFFAPSLQTGVVQRLDEQIVLVQSLPAPQIAPGWQRGQLVAPPQSRSVSPPFFTLSVHVGAWHAPFVHTPCTQSVGCEQVLPVSQRGQLVAPPQSLSDSP